VVVAEIGTGARTEQLALGETPNLAARVQGLAEPNTLVLSGATQRLVAGLFDAQDLGAQPLKGCGFHTEHIFTQQAGSPCAKGVT
jgi:class 3 adenylate cyclase